MNDHRHFPIAFYIKLCIYYYNDPYREQPTG